MSATDVAGSSASTAVRPFAVAYSDEELDDLRRRINATRWPERETVADDSQGVPLGLMQELARYWGTDSDWRPCEAKLNALPQFITEIDGLDIHFIHVRSQHEAALPLIVTHGWPGSVVEQLKIIEPLTNPTAHSASAGDAAGLGGHANIGSCRSRAARTRGSGARWRPAACRLSSWPQPRCRAWSSTMRSRCWS